MVGPGRAELAAAMGSSSVVVGLVLGQDRPQMSLAEDQHPVGDLHPGGAHMNRIHLDAYTAVLAIVVLAGIITLILALANPVR